MFSQFRYVAAAAALCASEALAGGSSLVLDVNSFSATASGSTFNASFTGTLTLAADASAGLFSVVKDGVGAGIGFDGPYAGSAFQFAGTWTFVSGNITGASMQVRLSTANNGVFDNIFSADIPAGAANIFSDTTPSGFFISAALSNCAFNDDTFGGVAIPEFFGAALNGSFFTFKVDATQLNGGSRTDNDVDMDIAVSVAPAPCAGDGNGDLIANFDDITTALTFWLMDYTPATDGEGDANHDGLVNFEDITEVLANWLNECP